MNNAKKKSTSNNKERLNKNLEFFNWVQEYSKKVVSMTFLIFVLANAFFLCLLTAEFIKTNELSYIDIYIQEIHLTFRDVIGGYLIKAATENALKIGGSYLESYVSMKSDAMRLQDDKENYEEEYYD